MKTLLLSLILLCAIPVSAQTTTTLRVQWEPNPVSENVVEYHVAVDGQPLLIVTPVTLPTCVCVETSIVVTPGDHSVQVRAVNLSLSTDPTSKQEGPALTATFTINVRVDVKGIRIRAAP